MSSISLTYAWVSPALDNYDQNNEPGQLDSNLEMWYWDKPNANPNKWVTTSGNDSLLFGLGEMTSIIELPEDSKTYVKFHMNETAVSNYQYRVLEESIAINISNSSGPKTVASVTYFDATPSQNCLDYYFYVGADNLDPTAVFADLESMSVQQFTDQGQHITSDYTSQDQYLYLMLRPRLQEIQNIIIEIPIIYSPYALTFAFSFVGEMRTIE
ncbi:MAG: hypothetical protein EOM77_06165 [Bacteroidia bacterium]|nr:hypothetical protein [Bacteroidia bacterium]